MIDNKNIAKWTIILIGVLAALSFALSYDNMRQLAVEHGKQGWRGLAWPILIDGGLIVFALVSVYKARYSLDTRLARCLVGLFTVATVYFNVAQYLDFVPTVVNLALVAVSAPIVLFVTFETLMDMIKDNVPQEVDTVTPDGTPEVNTVNKAVDTLSDRQLTLIEHIKQGVKSPSKLAKAVNVSRNTVYKDVKKLKSAGLVHENGKGLEITY